MAHLTEIFPDADALLALPPEDLIPVALRLLRERSSQGKVHSQSLLEGISGPPGYHEKGYPQHKKTQVERLLTETWNYMKRHGLLLEDAGQHPPNGWHYMSVDAEKIADGADLAPFIQGAQFPKSLLHPAIADSVWREVMRGEYDNAVMKAFRTVEESVRGGAPNAPKSYGKALMTCAFGNGGPLRDEAEDTDEADALMYLFIGAIGRFKNPQSHRTVAMDGRPARELVVFASWLLYFLDERKREILGRARKP